MLRALLILSVLCFAFAEKQDTTISAAAGNNEFAEYQESGNGVTTLTLSALKVNTDSNGNAQTTNIGAACFKVSVENSIVVYAGVFGGQVETEPDWTDNGNTNYIVNIQGAAAEIISQIGGMALYQEHDGVPGYGFSLTNPISCLLAGSNPTTDCMVDFINFQDVSCSWNYLTVGTQSCPSAGTPGSGYNTNCNLWTVQTTLTCGSNVVFSITIYFASQAVSVNGNPVSPGATKMTYECFMPYNNYPLRDQSNSHVALFVYNAAKTVTGGATATVVAGNQGISFAGTINSYFSWSQTSQNDNTAANTYVTQITGAQILGCNTPADPLSAIIIGVAKAVVIGWQFFGWNSTVVIFSWSGNQPSTIIYDPGLGNGNSSLSMTPCLWLTLFVLLFQYFSRKF